MSPEGDDLDGAWPAISFFYEVVCDKREYEDRLKVAQRLNSWNSELLTENHNDATE